MPRPLTGSVALITGGSRGLGLLLARELGRGGCRVAICARTAEHLDWARAWLQREGVTPVTQPCDVSDRQQVEQFLAHVRQHCGPVDILVNNAGLMDIGPVQHMTLGDFETAMAVMFWGTVYPTLAVYPDMVERRSGDIVNITSIGGKVSVPHLLPYACAKFASVGFSEGLHAELARYGVNVLTVVPGLMRTGSQVNVSIRGRRKAETLWFGLSASLPVMSMDAERAARHIVRAVQRRQAELILSWPAKLLHLVHAVLPGLTSSALGLVNATILPSPGGSAEPERLGDVQASMSSRMLDMATSWGHSAAERFQPTSVAKRN